jgi:hypothetical protein
MQSITGQLPTLNFRLVGDDEFRSRAELILGEAKVEHEWQRRDPCADAFRSSVCEDWPFLTDADFQLIDRHSNLLQFRSEPYAPDQAAAACQRMLALGARLLEADGWAMKCESSGISHARETWLKLASRVDLGYRRLTQAIGTPRERLQDRRNFWAVLYQTLVDAPIQVYSVFYSCGMHLLGQPEFIVKDDHLGGDHAETAADLFEAFAIHFLAECAPVGFQDGQSFGKAPSEASPFQLMWEACTEHGIDDCMHNPFGRWRFTRGLRKDRVHQGNCLAEQHVGPRVAT